MSKMCTRLEGDLVSNIITHRPDIAYREKVTVDDFAQDIFMCMECFGYNEGTMDNYRRIYDWTVSEEMRCNHIEAIAPLNVRIAFGKIKALGFAASYRIIAKVILNHIFKYAIALGYIAENPCANIEIRG